MSSDRPSETVVLKTSAYAVLAVSQNPESASSIKKMLQQAGETAFAATSTKQAWDEIRIGRVGLVVLDLTAPKADGVLLLSAARSARSTCTIPFLFLNSPEYKPLNLIIENDEQVRDGWLDMPCDIQSLSTAVTRLFQQKDYSRRVRSSSSASLKAASPADNSALNPSVLGGQLGPIDVPTVLGMLAPMALTGVLSVKGKKRKGTIYLVNGAVWHASVGEIHGPDALSILFRIAEGRFSFDPAPPPAVRSIQSNTMGILLDGLREKDETQQLLDKLRATEKSQS